MAESANALLDQILNRAKTKIASSAKHGIFDDTAIEQKLEALGSQVEKLKDIRDGKDQEVKKRILSAKTLTEIQDFQNGRIKDLGDAIYGIKRLTEQIGMNIEELKKLPPEAQKLIDDAHTAVEAAEQELEGAKRSYLFKDRKTAAAQAQLDETHTRQEDAYIDAQRIARERLRNHDLGSKVVLLNAMSNEAGNILENEDKKVQVKLTEVSREKLETFKAKEDAAKTVEILEAQLKECQSELSDAQQGLAAFENGTPEHAAQTELISELSKKFRLLEGERDTALGMYETSESGAYQLDIHEQALIAVSNSLRYWKAILLTAAKTRSTTIESELRIMDGAANQDVAQNIEEVGTERDLESAEYVATVAGVSGKMRIARLQQHKENMQHLFQIREGLAEGHVAEMKMMEEIIADYREAYGIDFEKSSFVPAEQERTS